MIRVPLIRIAYLRCLMILEYGKSTQQEMLDLQSGLLLLFFREMFFGQNVVEGEEGGRRSFGVQPPPTGMGHGI